MASCEDAQLQALAVDELKAYLDGALNAIGEHLAFQTAVILSRDAKAGMARTVDVVADTATLLAKNDTAGPWIVHVRANLPAGAGVGKLYLSGSQSDVKAAANAVNRATYMLLDEQLDFFTLHAGEALWALFTGNSGTAVIPIVEADIAANLQAIKKAAMLTRLMQFGQE